MFVRRASRWFVLVVSGVLLMPSTALSQGRTLKKIERKPAIQDAATLPPEVCIAAVHQIARAWGEGRLEDVLHREFPNRAELIDAVRRVSVRANNVALVVESVPATRFTPIQDRGGRKVTDCVADVVTRVLFDDPVTGQRQRGESGRAQWRIEFELPPQRGPGR